MLIRVTNTVEPSPEWVLNHFKYQDPNFYAILFDVSEEGPFEVTPGRTKVELIRKPVPVDTML